MSRKEDKERNKRTVKVALAKAAAENLGAEIGREFHGVDEHFLRIAVRRLVKTTIAWPLGVSHHSAVEIKNAGEEAAVTAAIDEGLKHRQKR